MFTLPPNPIVDPLPPAYTPHKKILRKSQTMVVQATYRLGKAKSKHYNVYNLCWIETEVRNGEQD